MAALLTTEGLIWVPASNGETVDDAVVGGTTDSGSVIHIARAHVHDEHHDELAAGSLCVGYDSAHIALSGKELQVSDYEVLCNRNETEIQWVASTGNNVPTGAVQCGRDERNLPIYVGRYCHEGIMVPGKFIFFTATCHIAWGGREHGSGEYEILCVKSVAPTSS